MTDFNKLADALESNSRFVRHGVSSHGDAELMLQAARILRAAGAADVAKLMMLHDVAAETRRVLISGGNVPQNEADRSRQSRAALESALRVALTPMGWQPIETAPKDGRHLILLLTPSGFPQVAYSNTWWTAGFSVECKPTHWMPLPAAQAGAQEPKP